MQVGRQVDRSRENSVEVLALALAEKLFPPFVKIKQTRLKASKNFDVAIFFIVELIFALVSLILSFLVRVTKLSIMDHVMGLVIGVIKTFCILIFIYGVVMTFSPVIPTDWTKDSYSMQAASYVWPSVRDILQSKGIIDFSHLAGKN